MSPKSSKKLKWKFLIILDEVSSAFNKQVMEITVFALCRHFLFSCVLKISGYPTLILFSRGTQKQEYRGPRDLDSLYNFAVQHHDEL